MDLYETIIKLAQDQGAVSPEIADASGSACVVDTDNGDVYYIELRKDKGN